MTATRRDRPGRNRPVLPGGIQPGTREARAWWLMCQIEDRHGALEELVGYTGAESRRTSEEAFVAAFDLLWDEHQSREAGK